MANRNLIKIHSTIKLLKQNQLLIEILHGKEKTRFIVYTVIIFQKSNINIKERS